MIDVPHSGVIVAGEIPLLRVLLKMALEDSGFNVVGEADDAQSLLILSQSLKPAVVLIDFNIEQSGLVRLIEDILDVDPVISIVVISDPIEGVGETVLAVGARAFLQKPFSMYDMTETVRKVKPVF
ncbi:MAG: DNA-binding response regulator [Candidatus Thorarchaeota archaeon]|nr:DNA-binding response regulator [Candidatus Thorarchaeota archaeon]